MSIKRGVVFFLTFSHYSGFWYHRSVLCLYYGIKKNRKNNNKSRTIYPKYRFIGESVRMIFDILSVKNNMKIKSYLVKMDIEKAFNSLDHSFLISVLHKIEFGEKFIDWIKILLHKQKLCVLNGCFTTKYYNLENGAHQGDPISAYLFILASNILFFLLIKNDSSIKRITVFDFVFLYTAYANDSTFFHTYI